ncbi:uncharacterized protein N7483_000214 [Penicillium malachiteum]|uniref:uncharacterized protein n=1 Tax=Penicillium malachiteum TaxID=1324776 RepID=UPI0025476A5E|nr:uncharacterized protein N7483_000214 [Penicillium malachiteum]KAJ5735089.1 hypothetical protein N7483_000214 [Penicillium malachiteum]
MLQSRLRPLPRRPVIPVADSQNAESFSDEEAPEDHFETFLAHLFPDDVSSFHGVPGEHLLYSSPRYGDLDIMVPSYPEKTEGSNTLDEDRQLQAHFLWSAGMIIAESVESADVPQSALADTETDSEDSSLREIWSARGESVLEFGAGAALPSLICALANASSITVTDHPSSPSLLGAVNFNLTHNLRSRKWESVGPEISIHPHQWGILSDPFAIENKARFTRIIAADCYWMPLQHENLCESLQWFLAPGGKVWMTAGFHTGRPIVAKFFETAKKYGLAVQCIWERDLIGADGTGEVRRDWVPVREDEGPENRKRWCVVAVLKRENE